MEAGGADGEAGAVDEQLDDGVHEEVVLRVGGGAEEGTRHAQRGGDPERAGGALEKRLERLQEERRRGFQQLRVHAIVETWKRGYRGSSERERTW